MRRSLSLRRLHRRRIVVIVRLDHDLLHGARCGLIVTRQPSAGSDGCAFALSASSFDAMLRLVVNLLRLADRLPGQGLHVGLQLRLRNLFRRVLRDIFQNIFGNIFGNIGFRSRLRRHFHIGCLGQRIFLGSGACRFAGILAVDIDDQPVRIRQQEGFVVRKIGHFEHNPRAPGLKLRHTNLLQEPVVHVEALAHQRRGQLGAAQVEENAVRTGNARRTELDVALQVDGDARVVRRRPVPDPGHARQPSRMGIRRFLPDARSVLGSG